MYAISYYISIIKYIYYLYVLLLPNFCRSQDFRLRDDFNRTAIVNTCPPACRCRAACASCAGEQRRRQLAARPLQLHRTRSGRARCSHRVRTQHRPSGQAQRSDQGTVAQPDAGRRGARFSAAPVRQPRTRAVLRRLRSAHQYGCGDQDRGASARRQDDRRRSDGAAAQARPRGRALSAAQQLGRSCVGVGTPALPLAAATDARGRPAATGHGKDDCRRGTGQGIPRHDRRLSEPWSVCRRYLAQGTLASRPGRALMIPWRMLRWTSACLLVGAGMLFAFTFHDRYWRWRSCFNDLGRCYDPISQQVYLEQAGIVWGGLAAISLLAGLGLLVRRRR